mmetsp:Transcript_63093/g.137103  ORF Transcript_63093/g.137103 Transcript_63093/m.137103 type:complete len:462 (-) Transcript_63093:60-1445(-)
MVWGILLTSALFIFQVADGLQLKGSDDALNVSAAVPPAVDEAHADPLKLVEQTRDPRALLEEVSIVTSASATEVSSEMLTAVQHMGENCWDPCKAASGFCDWCGERKACCRKGWPNSPTECRGITSYFTDVHECVTPVNPTVRRIEQNAKVEQPGRQPSIFVSVFSRLNATDRRHLIRDMWMRAVGNSGNVTVRFALCERNLANETLLEELKEENKEHGDLAFLDCDEGYGEGLLTKKVLASLKEYKSKHWNREMFMKVDDDTFVAWSKLSSLLVRRGHTDVYMGVPIDKALPCRETSFRWYEPYETWSEDYFPRAMAGGSGYVLGRTLVRKILGGLGEEHMLWNEDRAVGVWVDKMVRDGMPVSYVAIKGVDGFWAWNWRNPKENWATWAEYPHVVHHGLSPQTIACLSLAEMEAMEADPHKRIDDCFEPEVGVIHEPLKCAELTREKLMAEKRNEASGI